MSTRPPSTPAEPDRPVQSAELAEPVDAAVPAPATAGSSRLVTVLAVLLVLVFTPAWVDPSTIVELSGGTPVPPSGRALPAPDPLTGFVPLAIPVPPAAGPATTVARDTFARTASAGWGSPDVGAAYNPPSADEAPSLSVDGGHGVMSLAAPGDTLSAILGGAPARDVEVSFALGVDKLPADGNLYVYPLVRATDEGDAYRPRMFITQDGAVYVHAGLIIGGKEQSLGREVLVANVPDIAGHTLRLRAYVAGSDPTSVFVKVWDAALREPPQWQFGAIDWTGVLQPAGAVGVGAYLGRNVTNAPLTLRISDLTVTATDPTN